MLKDKEIKKMLVRQMYFIIFGVLIIFLVKTNLIQLLPECLFRKYLGIICATCGATRCAMNFINFNFKEAFLYHPVFFILILYIGFTDFIYIINTVFKKKFLKFLYPSVPVTIIFLVLLSIQYAYRLYLFSQGICNI